MTPDPHDTGTEAALLPCRATGTPSISHVRQAAGARHAAQRRNGVAQAQRAAGYRTTRRIRVCPACPQDAAQVTERSSRPGRRYMAPRTLSAVVLNIACCPKMIPTVSQSPLTRAERHWNGPLEWDGGMEQWNGTCSNWLQTHLQASPARTDILQRNALPAETSFPESLLPNPPQTSVRVFRCSGVEVFRCSRKVRRFNARQIC